MPAIPMHPDPLALDYNQAYDFYRTYILDHTRGKYKVYMKYGFTEHDLQQCVPSKDWEVFAAILMCDRAKPGDGADLERHEVKSASIGSAFEYQYHKDHGLQKLEEDKNVDHVFISRSGDYKSIRVYWLSGAQLASEYFDQWLPDLKANYRDELRQRFRRAVTYRFVTQQGVKLLAVEHGRLIYPRQP